MDDGSDNQEDMQELESRLYSQVFHGSPLIEDNSKDLTNSEHVTVTAGSSQIKNRLPRKRYWTQSKNDKDENQKPNFEKFKNFGNKFNKNKNNAINASETIANNVSVVELNKDSSTFLKPFEPYEPLFSQPNKNISHNAKTNLNPIIKKTNKVNNTKKKSLISSGKFQNNINQKILENQKKKKLVNQNWQISQSDFHHKNKLTTANQAKQNKIDSFQKINEKKAKSQYIREKNKNKQLSKAEEIIILEDSENDDDDDVICIPAPPPPLIAVDNSDDEESKSDTKESPQKKFRENVFDKAKIKFTKPKTRKSNSACASTIQNTSQSNNSSRCTSPSSTFSTDDFITVGEKSRLLEVCNVDDDDLIITETVDSFVQRKDKSRKTNDNLSDNTKTLNMPPPTIVEKIKPQQVHKKKQKNSTTDYLVKENSFRAVDVYDESESDFSVYSKGSASNKNEVPKDNEAVLSSSTSSSISDIDQIDIIQKVKRLRKRRASSNRESSDKKSSEESESENEINKTSTGLPYISKGEAVEKVRKRRKSSQLNSNVQSSSSVQQMNSSDNEFVLELNKIVQKNKIDKKDISLNNNTSNDSNCSDELGENVTARAIVEDVINKSQQSKQQKNKDKADNIELPSQNTEIKVIDVVLKEEFYASTLAESTPKKPIVSEHILKNAFDEIEKINVSVELCREKSPEMDSLDITQTDIEEENEESFVKDTSMVYEEILESNKTEVNGVTYYRIDSHSTDQIGWPEEMYRFYNMSWGGENFTVKGVKQSLNRTSNWNINSNDRYPKFTKHSKMKCFNCCEFGHISAKCSKPRKPLVCYMCGEQGHREARCPNTICLKCGSKTPTFTKGCKKCSFQNNHFCYICKLHGHTSNLCPDKWRRYHSTVTPNTDPNNRVKYKNIKFCCVCAGRGHLPEQCKYAKIYLEYQPSLSQIKSHISTVAKQPNFTVLSNSTITYNLLYKPNNNFQFSFSFNKEFKNNEYYGRFITACKLNHLFKQQYENSPSKNENNLNIERALKKIKKNANKTNKELFPDHQFKLPNMVIEKSNNGIEEQNKESKSIVSSTNESTNNLNKTEDELIKTEQTQTSATASKDFVFDSDSNYSFSDHFDVSKTDDNNSIKCTDKLKELDLSKPQRTSRPMGELPDFIPLTGNDKYEKVERVNEVVNSEEKIDADENLIRFSDDIFKMPDLNFSLGENNDNEYIEDYGDQPMQGISHKLRHISESDIDESEYPDIPCVGKIFLPKNFSDYLLSPNGNKFLIENSNKYNIRASIDWTSVGNVLVLEGLKDNQNKFHIQLMLELRALPKKIKNDLLEQSLRVPRKRSVLIKFLQDDLERLDQRIGNVYDLFKQLQMYEYQHSKNGLRQAQRIRTKLNMILLGQAGLRDGNKNLENLLKHLIQLQKENNKNINYNQKNNNNDTDNVTQNQRNEIDKSWKYIFSPLEHKNYNELIDSYYKLKRTNNLPILKMRDRINNGNIQFNINTSFNSFLNQKQNQLNQMTTNSNIKLEEESTNTLKRKEQYPSELDHIANIKIPKLFFNITDTNLTAASTSLTSFYDNERQQQHNKNNNIVDNVNNNSTSGLQMDFLNKINGELDEIIMKEKNLSLSAEMASLFWSKESLKFLNDISKSQNWNVFIKKKIQQALNYATNGMLSHSDYRKILSLKLFIDSQNKF